MKPNGKVRSWCCWHVAVVGCSKRGETPQAKGTAQKPAANRSPSKQADGEGFDEAAAPKVASPASFAEGEAAYHAKTTATRRDLQVYTTRRPENAWGHYMLGLSAWKNGDPAGASSAFEVALRIDPKHVKSYVNLSRVLIEQKRLDDAIEQLTRASEADPESTEMPRLMARVYSAQQKTDEAIDAYRRAIAINDLDAWSMNNLGLLFLEQGFVEDAVPYLARAVEIK